MNLGSAIKKIRKKTGYTQYELAKKANISTTSLSQIENNDKRPRERTMRKLTAAMEIPESIIYILAIERTDVPDSSRAIYDLLFPSIVVMALQIAEHR